MKKVAVVILALALLTVTFAAVPAFAAPTDSANKVPVKILWAPVPGSATTVENRKVDNLSHRVITNKWTLQLFIGDSVTPIAGTADCTRHVLYAFAKEPQMGVYQDD